MRGYGRAVLLAAAMTAMTAAMAAGGGAAAAEPMGWTAGPAADATMETGRRFACEGADCPAGGLTCLHGVAPGGPGQGRTLRVHDMLRPKAFPWKDFEGWIGAKVRQIRPQLAKANGGLKADADARLARLGERDFMRRSYRIEAASENDAVEVGLWVTDNQLNTAVCTANAVDLVVAGPRIEAFFDAMNASPPTPPYDPLAGQ